jgi:hypothetical protein
MFFEFFPGTAFQQSLCVICYRFIHVPRHPVFAAELLFAVELRESSFHARVHRDPVRLPGFAGVIRKRLLKAARIRGDV